MLAYLTGAVMFALPFGGCALIKDGEEISWSKVDTLCSVMRIAAQTSTYAVCVKNQDLSPIFQGVGEGLIILSGTATEESVTPEALKEFITKQVKAQEWGTLAVQINGIIDELCNAYTNFYKANKDKFKDYVIVCSSVMNAMGRGFITGSQVQMQTLIIKSSAERKTPDQRMEEAFKALHSVNMDVSTR